MLSFLCSVTGGATDGAAALLAGLLDSAMDAIITVDEGQNIVQYNRAAERIFGWPASGMIGQPLTRLMPARFGPTHAAHVREFGDTGVSSRRMGGSAVVYGLRADGTEFPVDASISHLQSPAGKLFTVIMRDVTERVRAHEELAQLAAEASAIREQEKTRVARELHDELAQSLTALKMDTIWLRDRLGEDGGDVRDKLGGMLEMLDGSVAATRRIAADLRPLLLDDLGLGAAIEWLVQNFTQRHGIACTLEMDEALDLGEPHATAVFRIVQESLANVAKHADASCVHVQVVHDGGGVTLTVRDDGRGFDTSGPRKPHSLGLAGLRERAHLLRGTVGLESAPGRGTVVRVRIPLEVSGAAP